MPLAWQDVADAASDDLQQGGSGVKGAAKGALSLFGFGVNTTTPKTQEEKIDEIAARLREAPENQGLTDRKLRHNAKVSLEVNRLLRGIPEKNLGTARRIINSYFYFARVRGADDKRIFSAIERVFEDKRRNAAKELSERLDALKEQ